MGWGPRREVVLGKGIGGEGRLVALLSSLWIYFLSLSLFCRKHLLTSRQLDTQVLEVHILYLRRFTKLQKLHMYILEDQNFKHLYHTCICKTRVPGYVELQMKI